MDYDDGTWRSRVFDPIGLTVTTTRGGTQDKVSVTLGKRVTTYDVSGRPVKVARYAAGADPAVATPYSTRTLAYDGWHRLRSRTDALGNTTTYDYDDWHRPVHTTLPDGSVLTRSYRPDSARADVVKLTLANAGSKLAETALGTRVFDGLGRVTAASVGGRPGSTSTTCPMPTASCWIRVRRRSRRRTARSASTPISRRWATRSRRCRATRTRRP